MSLREQLSRRKPIVPPTPHPGWARTSDRNLPALDDRRRRHGRHRHLLRDARSGAARRTGRADLVRARRPRGRTVRALLRRDGLGGADLGIVLLLRLRDARRGGRDARGGLPGAGVRRVDRGRRLRLERISQPAARRPLRLADPARAQRGAGRGRDHQPSRDRARRHVHAAADPRHAGVHRRSTRSW